MKRDKMWEKMKSCGFFQAMGAGLLLLGVILVSPGVEAKEAKKWPDFVLFFFPMVIGFCILFIGEKLVSLIFRFPRG